MMAPHILKDGTVKQLSLHWVCNQEMRLVWQINVFIPKFTLSLFMKVKIYSEILILNLIFLYYLPIENLFFIIFLVIVLMG